MICHGAVVTVHMRNTCRSAFREEGGTGEAAGGKDRALGLPERPGRAHREAGGRRQALTPPVDARIYWIDGFFVSCYNDTDHSL